jgi:hypothetical protein
MYQLTEEVALNYIRKEVECYGLKNTTIVVRPLKNGKFRVKVENIDAEINEIVSNFKEFKEQIQVFHDEMMYSTSETLY